MSAFVPAYRMGDVVCIDGEEHIISEVNLNRDDNGDYSYDYATNLSAWHNHDDIVLVRPADAASMEQLVKDLNDEEASNYEEL